MIKQLITIIFIFSTSSTLFCQGYRGHKFAMTYQPGVSMLRNPYDPSNFLFHQKVNLSLAIKKHWSVNFTGAYTNSKIMKSRGYDTVQVRDITAGINFCYFYKNHQSFAPVGRYFGFGLDIGTENEVITKKIMSGFSTSQIMNSSTAANKRVYMGIFSVYFGKNYLIAERILLGYSLQLGYTFGQGPALRHLAKPQGLIGFIF